MKSDESIALYKQAINLPDDKMLVVRYEISKENFGKIVLSNNLFNSLTKKEADELKRHLSFIEKYAVECYLIPRPN